jgi:mannose-6-phosphate isomerase-like protein (cupin superfamily)
MKNYFRCLSSAFDTEKAAATMDGSHRWREHRLRQEYEGSNHADTECIFFRMPEDLSLKGAWTDLSAVNYPATHEFPLVTELLRRSVALVLDAMSLGRVMAVSLKPGGVITAHVDEGVYANHYMRFHLVLRGTCYFRCGLETVHMRAGQLWWFNHTQEHEVFNDGESPRINLIFDAVSPTYRRLAHA